jgi:hypothetical protein
MVDSLRLACMVVMLLAVALAAALLQPEVAHDLGLAQWDLTVLEKEWFSDSSARTRHDEHNKALQRRLFLKSEATKELIAGKRTVLETISQFRRVNEENDVPQCRWPGPLSEEEIGQQVLQWARGHLRLTYPEAVDDTVARLEEEWRRHKEPNGKARRPAFVAQ